MLRHSKEDLNMCRRTAGTAVGFLCTKHEGRCVICDTQYEDILDTMRCVYLCDDCGLVPDGEERCIMCGSNKIAGVAYYCQYCVALEKDRDGCPRTTNQTRQQRLAAMKRRGRVEDNYTSEPKKGKKKAQRLNRTTPATN